MDKISLDAKTRTTLGKKVRALRRDGLMPIHVYGLDDAPLALQASSESVHQVLSSAGRTAPVAINVDGKGEQVALVRDVAQHPVSGAVQHVDFIRVDPDRAVEVPVPIMLEGEAPGVRGSAGVVTQGLYEVVVTAKPFDTPQQIIADVSPLEDTTYAITVGDLPYPPGVQPVTERDVRVAWIQVPRAALELEAEEEAAAAELAADAEGEADAPSAEDEGAS